MLKSTSPSCLGELILNSMPDFSQISRAFALAFALEALRHFGEHFGVDLDAGGLNTCQHRRHREINVVVKLGEPGVADLIGAVFRRAQREVGGFGERVAHLQVEGASATSASPYLV